MILLLLAACGVDGPLDQPLPPPEPPNVLFSAEPDVVQQQGIATEVHGPTRSFVLTGEGKRVIVHLRDTGTLRLGGQPSQLQDLKPGTTVWVEGKRIGDLLMVLRASDQPEEVVATPAAAATPAPGVAPADGATPAAGAAPAEGAAPGAPTDGAAAPTPVEAAPTAPAAPATSTPPG